MAWRVGPSSTSFSPPTNPNNIGRQLSAALMKRVDLKIQAANSVVPAVLSIGCDGQTVLDPLNGTTCNNGSGPLVLINPQTRTLLATPAGRGSISGGAFFEEVAPAPKVYLLRFVDTVGNLWDRYGTWLSDGWTVASLMAAAAARVKTYSDTRGACIRIAKQVGGGAATAAAVQSAIDAGPASSSAALAAAQAAVASVPIRENQEYKILGIPEDILCTIVGANSQSISPAFYSNMPWQGDQNRTIHRGGMCPGGSPGATDQVRTDDLLLSIEHRAVTLIDPGFFGYVALGGVAQVNVRAAPGTGAGLPLLNALAPVQTGDVTAVAMPAVTAVSSVIDGGWWLNHLEQGYVDPPTPFPCAEFGRGGRYMTRIVVNRATFMPSIVPPLILLKDDPGMTAVVLTATPNTDSVTMYQHWQTVTRALAVQL